MMMSSRDIKCSIDLMSYLESTASEEAVLSVSDILYKHEEDIYRLEKILENVLYGFNKILIKIDEISNAIKYVERKITELEEKLEEQEKVILIKEVPFEEAKKMVMDYLSTKKGEITTPLEVADALKLPYETVHEIFLQLIKEGKLEIKDLEDI